jgi:pyruvate-formate lyase-activating enzyme
MLAKHLYKGQLAGKRVLYRHLRPLLKYSTPKKLMNLLLCEAERRLRVIKPRSKPYLGVVDITNVCNLRCYHCPTGKHLYGRKPGFMDISYVEEFLQKLGKFLYIAHLFSWGEPLLHPDIAGIIRLVRSHRVSTSVSSNMNFRNKALLDEICDAGLDYLAMSIDGSSQEVYSRYRVGGDLDLVLENIRHISQYKKRNNLRIPLVEWQFLIFDHNRHEVKSAHELAKELGVDVFNAKPGIIPNKFHEAWRGSSQCPFLWNTIGLQVDGGISACCNLIDKEDDFGNLSGQPFEQIWHASRYETARILFSPERARNLPRDLRHPCLNCSLVRLQPHLVDYLRTNKHTCSDESVSIHKDDTIAVRSGAKSN